MFWTNFQKQLSNIKITNFKGVKQTFFFDLSNQLMVLIGENGAGKTILLKQLYSICNEKKLLSVYCSCDAIEWNQDKEIKRKKGFNYNGRGFKIIKNALNRFWSNFASGYSCFRVVNEELILNKNNVDLKLSQLSRGEQRWFFIVTDIAIRLAIAHPNLEISKVLEKEIIVFIDEIEEHLHPGWQRSIILALTKTFPNCHFVITTHSPQILDKVKSENVFILKDKEIYSPDSQTYGRDSNSILKKTMGICERPIEIQKKLDECSALINNNQLKEAKYRLHKLSDLLGLNDSEIIAASTKINLTLKLKDK